MQQLKDDIEKLEISVEAADEVLVEKLSELDARMCELERKQEAEMNQLKADISSEIEELKNSFRINEKSIDSPLLTSTPVHRNPFQEQGKGAGHTGTLITPAEQQRSHVFSAFVMPSSLDDVQPQIREKIRQYVSINRDQKEKLNTVQLAFCTYWLSENRPEYARKSTAIALREAGIQAKMWKASWKPEIVGDFDSYLIEKIKQWQKKQKKDGLKLGIKRKADQAVYTCD